MEKMTFGVVRRRDGLAPSGLQLAATLTLCAALVAIAGLGTAVQDQTTAALDEHWRGGYDVLVTAPGEDFGGSATDGLVDANFVATAGEGAISLRLLDAVRAIEGVEVAAPIGMVGVQRARSNTPQLYLNDEPATGESILAPEVQLFRIAAELRRETGVGEEIVWRSSGVAALQQRPADFYEQVEPSPAGMGWPGGFAPIATNFSQQIQLGRLPEFGSTIIAVDPEAERELLGEQGAFLDPLLAMPEQRTIGELGSGWARSAIDVERYAVESLTAMFDADDPVRASQPVVPLIVNEAVPTTMTLRVAIERSDDAPNELPETFQLMEEIALAASFTPWEVVERDVSNVAVPFSSPNLVVLWPGSQLYPGEDGGFLTSASSVLTPQLIGRPSYRPAETGREPLPSFEVRPRGVVGPDGLAPPEEADEWGTVLGVGEQRAYRPLVDVEGRGLEGALPAPLGEFDSDLLDLDVDAASYVPYGAYDPAITRLLDVPGHPRLLPSLSGLDFVTGPPGAITDLQGGDTLRGEPPIDAIRVRVAGVAGYTEQALQRVEDVAAEIAALGLQATVVAGSSPQPVAIYVPDWHSGEDLGWVEQEWTTLEAVTVVAGALTDLERLLVALALATASLGMLATGVLAGRHQRHAVGVLRTIGWTESQLRSTLLRHQAPLPLLILMATGLSVVLGTRPELVTAAAWLGAVTAVLATTVATISALGTPARPGPRRRAGGGLASARALAMRLLSATPAPTALQVIGLAELGVSILATLTALRIARDAAGPTRLAGVVLDQTAVASLTLAFAGIAAAAILIAIGQRASQQQHAHQWTTLRTLGIPEGTLHRILAWEGGLLACVALVVAAGSALVLPALDVTAGDASLAGAAILVAACVGAISRSTVPTRTAS